MRQATIIGCGPAGISTAIYLKRSNVDCLVIGKDFGALKDYPKSIENYYGFKDPISGNDLINNGILQAKRLGVDVITEDVIALYDRGSFFEIKTNHEVYTSRTVILTTGKVRLTLDVPGFRKFVGKGVSLCAACDGYFYKKKKLAVIGNGAYMKNELSYLKRLTDDITIFTNGEPLIEDVGLTIITDPIKELLGDLRLTHVRTQNDTYTIDGVFLAIGAPSSLEFASQLGVIVEKGSVIVDENYQTNIPGLFAAGDIIGGKLQIAKAVYDGMNTAESVIKYLKT